MADIKETLIAMLTGRSLDTYEDTKYVADELIANGVAPVVRCKDCKHTDTDGLGAIYCQKWDRWEIPHDFFCYYGERKDGEG